MIFIRFCLDGMFYFGSLNVPVMSSGEEIVLRPRFKFEISEASEKNFFRHQIRFYPLKYFTINIMVKIENTIPNIKATKLLLFSKSLLISSSK